MSLKSITGSTVSKQHMRIPTLAEARAVILHRHAVKLLVLGHQKSGTTAIGALLAKMMGGSYANDPLFLYDWGHGQAVKDVVDHPERLGPLVSRNRRLFCNTVLKDPDLTFLIPECRRIFTNAQVVFVMRDPRNTIRSIADRLQLTSDDLQQSADALELPNRHWQLILASQLPDVGGTTVAEVLALRWQRAANEYLRNAEQVHLIRYEDFLADRSLELRRILSELDIRQRADVTQWLDHQFQPKGNRHTDLYERLGTRNLEAIERICAETMAQFDYNAG